MVKGRLNPGGIVTQWVPLYESDLDTVKSEIATFFDVFPNGAICANDENGDGYDLVMLGRSATTKIDVDGWNTASTRIPFRRGALARGRRLRVGDSMFGTYAGNAHELRQWLTDAEINHDRDLRLQYLAGFRSNLYQSEGIFNEIVKYRKFPDNLSPARRPACKL